MKKIKNDIIRILSVFIITAVLFTGCSSGQNRKSNRRPSGSVVVVMGTNSEPESGFDPAYGWGAGEHVHEPLIQSTLTVTTNDLKIGNDLAAEITQSEDGLAWTVKIRDDVSFTDGEKLTASDVAFTYNIVKETSSVNDFTMLDYAEAADDTTVVFHLTRPYSIWPYTMAVVGIVPKHAYDKNYGQNPVGSGRYMLKQWDQGQQVILEANPDYYGDTPEITQLTVLFMSEESAFAAVQAGEADVAYTAASYADQSVAGYQLKAFQSVDNRGMNLPAVPSANGIGNDVTADPAVRQAINIGIDREKLVQDILNGHGSPAYSVCDGMPWYLEGSEVQFDRKAANRILDDAGWKKGSDGVRSKDGVRAELNILYPAGDSDRQALAAEVSSQLKGLGMAVTYEGVGWDTAYKRAQSEIMTWGWGAHTPMEFYNLYHTDAKTGLAGYSPYANPAADAYMDEALQSTELESAYALWQKAQWDGTGGVNQDLPWVWLVNVDHLYWVNEGLDLGTQKRHPHGHGWSVVNNVNEWKAQK